jgi:hypothetical protein
MGAVADMEAVAGAGPTGAAEQPSPQTDAAPDAGAEGPEAAEQAAADSKADAIVRAAFAKATAAGAPPPEPDEKTGEGEDKPVGDEASERAEADAVLAEAVTLDGQCTRMAKQLGYSEEDIAEQIKEFGLEAFASVVRHGAAQYARHLNKLDLETQGKTDGGEAKTVKAPEKKTEAEAPKTPEALDLSGLKEYGDDDELDAGNAREKINALVKIVKALAEGSGVAPALKDDIAFVQSLKAEREAEQIQKHEKGVDAFFAELHGQFPQYGDKSDSSYADTDPHHLARMEVYESAALLREAHQKRTGRPMSWTDALDLAHNSLNIDTIRKGGERLRQERRTARRRDRKSVV